MLMQFLLYLHLCIHSSLLLHNHHLDLLRLHVILMFLRQMLLYLFLLLRILLVHGLLLHNH